MLTGCVFWRRCQVAVCLSCLYALAAGPYQPGRTSPKHPRSDEGDGEHDDEEDEDDDDEEEDDGEEQDESGGDDTVQPQDGDRTNGGDASDRTEPDGAGSGGGGGEGAALTAAEAGEAGAAEEQETVAESDAEVEVDLRMKRLMDHAQETYGEEWAASVEKQKEEEAEQEMWSEAFSFGGGGGGADSFGAAGGGGTDGAGTGGGGVVAPAVSAAVQKAAAKKSEAILMLMRRHPGHKLVAYPGVALVALILGRQPAAGSHATAGLDLSLRPIRRYLSWRETVISQAQSAAKVVQRLKSMKLSSAWSTWVETVRRMQSATRWVRFGPSK
eukprot:SAG22_NODE_69_length_22779_cov_71.088139_5_plen_328_part_00